MNSEKKILEANFENKISNLKIDLQKNEIEIKNWKKICENLNKEKLNLDKDLNFHHMEKKIFENKNYDLQEKLENMNEHVLNLQLEIKDLEKDLQLKIKDLEKVQEFTFADRNKKNVIISENELALLDVLKFQEKISYFTKLVRVKRKIKKYEPTCFKFTTTNEEMRCWSKN